MTGLSRQLGLSTLILYGIGDILGAGIYALVGRVASEAGTAAWISFLVAAVLAAVTGLSYAELTSRIPRAAGAAAFCGQAFRHPLLPHLVGFFVLASGLTSTTTVSLAVYGYLKIFIEIPQIPAAIALIAALSFINFWGIRESAAANNVLTVVEVLGVLLVIIVGLSHAAARPSAELLRALSPQAGLGEILAGATIAFYAFIGFEDLANLAEEAKAPSRDIPRAILTAVAVTTLLYLTVVCVVLWAMPPEQAAASERPLLDVLKIGGWGLPDRAFAPVALVAVLNTGLANLIMASRLLYGMAQEGWLPAGLARIHASRRTPWVAVLAAMLLCMVLVISAGAEGVKTIAQTTSLLLMLAFLMVHLSLIAIRRRDENSTLTSLEKGFRAPSFVPYAGVAACLLVASRAPLQAYLRAGFVALIAILIYASVRRARLLPGNAPTRS
ncbi:MAG: amino acid permease [Elusimicrobia bacterium]|nr:amino acid permease [Elusimicrobiota bacterium]